MIKIEFTLNELLGLRAIASDGFLSMWEETQKLDQEDPESPTTKAAKEFSYHASSGLARLGASLDIEEEKEILSLVEVASANARDVTELMEVFEQDPHYGKKDSNDTE